MVKDYTDYRNIYYISIKGNEYEVTGNSNDSALRCLSRYLNYHVGYGLINKIAVIGSAKSPMKVVYKKNGEVINVLDDVNYL